MRLDNRVRDADAADEPADGKMSSSSDTTKRLTEHQASKSFWDGGIDGEAFTPEET